MRCNHLLVYKRTVEGILAGMRTERSFGGPRGDFNQGIVGRLGLGTYTCTEVLPLSFSLSLSLPLSLAQFMFRDYLGIRHLSDCKSECVLERLRVCGLPKEGLRINHRDMGRC